MVGAGGGTTAIMMNAVTNAVTAGNSRGGDLRKQMSFLTLKTDEIEVLEEDNPEEQGQVDKHSGLAWICCAPCIWLRTSTAVHKISISTATLLVTSLLVASPILFLISTAPSQLPRDCYTDNDECSPTVASPIECNEFACRKVAAGLQSKLNWKYDPCKDFKQFSCSYQQGSLSLRALRSAQETVDMQMQQLLQHNTTSGPFRKLGHLYGSCLRQQINSSTIKLVLEELGGYLPIGTLGPSTIATLISKIYEIGPTPLIDVYYDLSYGPRPQILLIVAGPSITSPVIESKIRWVYPKVPQFSVQEMVPKILDDLMDAFLPLGLTYDQKEAEKEMIKTFVRQLNKVRIQHVKKGFWDSSILYNTTSLNRLYPIINWTALIPCNWTGPIVVRSSEYLKKLQVLFTKHPSRVAHNSILLLFVAGILPKEYPDPIICTKATMWALPETTSTLYMTQHSNGGIKEVLNRLEAIFNSVKGHLKRAPSLKGAALVKLSALKLQSTPWPVFNNLTISIHKLEQLEITSDDWFANILNIYKRNKIVPEGLQELDNTMAWAYPVVAKIFYDTLSHSIVVPLSVIMVPYFDVKLPQYLQYASVGVAIAKEILRSITKTFEDKAMRCVPSSVQVFSNYSRMEMLVQSGGMQISYHAMLSLTGSVKSMPRLPGLDLTPKQIFFLVSAQELCAESYYARIDTESEDFSSIIGWLIAQGGSATEVFNCASDSMIYAQKTCNVL